VYKLQKDYPRLVRMVERSNHSRFKRRPTLVVCKGGRPRGESERIRRGKRVVGVSKSRIFIPRRMARENKPLARLAVIHELREDLAFQNGNCKTKSHKLALKAEKAYRRRVGSKSGGRLLNDFYRR